MMTVRQAHNVLALIAHRAMLNGDDRQTVMEANKTLVEFIQAHEPKPTPPEAGKVDPMSREIKIPDIDTRIDALRNGQAKKEKAKR